MTAWGGGYVTDVNYIAQFHAIQSQSLMAVSALLNNFAARPARRDEAYHICDIGCGLGITALVTAAANPGWRVTGLDFNPAHIAGARELAAEAGIENVQFHEVDLRDYAATVKDLPPFDAVTMHGVWTWVDVPVQDGILRLLNDKLLPGGLCYISYNLATGWQGAIGLQRLVREAGLRLASRSDKQAAAGFDVAIALAAADGQVSYDEGSGKGLMARYPELPPAYLAHELMNVFWKPVMHLDVAARLAAAKMEYAGSSRLMKNFPQLTLTEGQREVLAKFDDPAMAELFKDVCRPEMLRSDVFIRGAQRIPPGRRDAALGEIVLGLTATEPNWKFEFELGGSKAQMNEGYYRTIFARLLEGPAEVRELLALPDLQGRRDNPAELIAVSIDLAMTATVPNPGAAMDERCGRLNRILFGRQTAGGQQSDSMNFALPSMGAAMTLPVFQGILLQELSLNPEIADPDVLAVRLGGGQSPEDRAKIADAIRRFFVGEAKLLRNFGFAL